VCGIFGVFVRKDSGLDESFLKDSLRTVALLSEDRGKDSSGLVFRNEQSRELHVVKGAVPISFLLKSPEVVRRLDEVAGQLAPFAVMGHSRLVTNGSHLDDENNQPILKDGGVAIHNGIIVNERDLWSAHPDVHRTTEIDTEVMLALARRYIREGWDVPSAISRTVREVVGTVSAAFLFEDMDTLALATNNGSLYVLTDDATLMAFASERYFLTELARNMGLAGRGSYGIRPIPTGFGLTLDLKAFRLENFGFADEGRKAVPSGAPAWPYKTTIQTVTDGKPAQPLILDPARIACLPGAAREAAVLEHNVERILALRRCTLCVLPETFPFIEFDEHGVCNYCSDYVLKNRPKPIQELFDLVAPYRRSDGAHDCIIPYSGGRDSTHTLHVAKKVLGLNPVAFTYDWGMVNDLARRNIARVCGKLGVENIIVSADIATKRSNIRKNILAWLKRPELGMVPLFMAGDKYFFYYTDQVKKRTGLRLNIWGINPLENTDFKVGFLGVPPDHHKERIYSLSAGRKGKLISAIAWNIVRNPRYLNSSVWDTIGSFVSRSVVPHRDYYHLYDYYRWDEQEIENLVLHEYDWEKAIDTQTTWRIGDGTAPFYNYVYYTAAGFSEYDTFRSNQIREGMMSREEALRLVTKENEPRYSSIKWYTEIVGLDFVSTMKRINEIPKLYP
jgi:glucosamine--fructose-6-phosphate aminotransferase (isomerizing)